ncbi:MAG: hypothetical protein M1820_004911 [Bogoriella megaspora]|nr:MAG: hypothetical protein M1820_004911 [Bogoriella megaspora]
MYSPGAGASNQPFSQPAGSSLPSSRSAGYPQGPWTNRYSRDGRVLTGLGLSPPERPPLPHEPQAHFTNIPDINFAGIPHRSIPAGSHQYFCGWDSLVIGTWEPNTHPENVLLVGSEGCLDTYQAREGDLRHIGRLQNLPGAVIGAQILPKLGFQGSESLSVPFWPLVAIIIHGPVIDPEQPASQPTSSPQPASSPKPAEPSKPTKARDRISSFQTSVELYSLRTGQPLGTLFRTKPVKLNTTIDNINFVTPPPQGDLRVDVREQLITVASGISGEVYVFDMQFDATQEAQAGDCPRFRCLAKLWTSPQNRKASSTPGEMGAPLPTTSKALLSLTLRWLALVPPTSASTIDGEVPCLEHQKYKPPGVKNYNAPAPPDWNSTAEGPEVDTALDKLSKSVAKTAISNAKWVGEKGTETFNSWIGKSPPHSSLTSPESAGETGHAPTGYFPPTHGLTGDETAPNREPKVVSIYDLRQLQQDADEMTPRNFKPLTTFIPPLGCNFVSLSPDGKRLMTVSEKGDYQFIWSCLNMDHLWSPRADQDGRVREITRFVRTTEACIIDVRWKAPQGDIVAILTANGTIHVHRLPSDALRGIFPSRPWSPADAPEEDRPKSGGWAISAASGARNAFNTISSAASAARRRSSSAHSGEQNSSKPIYSTIGSAFSSAASSGGRAVSRGFSNGYGYASDGLATLRHAHTNKIKVPVGLATPLAPRRIRFLDGASASSISVIADGRVFICPYKLVTLSHKMQAPMVHVKILGAEAYEVAIARIADIRVAPVVQAWLDEDMLIDKELTLAEPTARFDIPLPKFKDGSREAFRNDWRAEVEMGNAPRKTPVWRQPGVKMFVYEETGSNEGDVVDDGDFGLEDEDAGTERWAFGGSLGERRRVRVKRLAGEDDEAVQPREVKGGVDADWEEV